MASVDTLPPGPTVLRTVLATPDETTIPEAPDTRTDLPIRSVVVSSRGTDPSVVLRTRTESTISAVMPLQYTLYLSEPSITTASQLSLNITTSTSTTLLTPISFTTETPRRNSTPGGGAIAGAVIGALLSLLIILGALLIVRPRRRVRETSSVHPDEAMMKREPDESTGGEKDTTFNYEMYALELAGTELAQELDPSKGNTAVMRANELKAQSRDVELPGVQHSQDADSLLRPIASKRANERPYEQTTTPELSPHVEAQRKREVEWLEMEEIKLRQRREQLMHQGGTPPG